MVHTGTRLNEPQKPRQKHTTKRSHSSGHSQVPVVLSATEGCTRLPHTSTCWFEPSPNNIPGDDRAANGRPAAPRYGAERAHQHGHQTTWIHEQKTIESLEHINSIREANGSFDSCKSCKQLGISRLHELHDSKLFVSHRHRIYPLRTFEFLLTYRIYPF